MPEITRSPAHPGAVYAPEHTPPMNRKRTPHMTDPHTPPDEGGTQPPGSEADRRRALTHNLRNSVYAIVLQAESAEQHATAGKTDAALQAIARIKSAAHETAEHLDTLLKDVRGDD